MPSLECPRCHRTAWVRVPGGEAIACGHCGSTLSSAPVDDTAFLTGAVRSRLARDGADDAARPRFLREPHRLTD